MPLPFDILVVMFFLGYYADTPPAAVPSLAHAATVVAAAGIGLAAAAWIANRLGLRLLAARPGCDRRRVAAWLAAGVRLVLVACYVATLEVSAFPWSLARTAGGRGAAGDLAVQLAGLPPYLLFFFLVWLPLFGLFRATSSGYWTRRSFLIHQARYNLYLLLAWVPFALVAEWLSGFLLLLPLVFFLAAWCFPALLARAWGCRRLPPGDTLTAVRRLEERTGVGFSRVYLWEPGGGRVQNAAAVGMFRPFRYLFLTPALVDSLRPSELEAVILHELGHVKHRHLLFYLITSMAGINLAVILGALLPLAGANERFLVTLVLVLGYFRLVFGWLSRNMERQADLYALEQSGGAADLVNALERLALSAGKIRLAASWHHLGIAERVAFLRRAEESPALGCSHHAVIAVMKGMGIAAAVAVLALLGWLIHADLAGNGAPPAVPAASAEADEAHWRRVLTLAPDNTTARLELAYRLAGRTETAAEARDLARRVRQDSADGEERNAAARLLQDLDEATVHGRP